MSFLRKINSVLQHLIFGLFKSSVHMTIIHQGICQDINFSKIFTPILKVLIVCEDVWILTEIRFGLQRTYILKKVSEMSFKGSNWFKWKLLNPWCSPTRVTQNRPNEKKFLNIFRKCLIPFSRTTVVFWLHCSDHFQNKSNWGIVGHSFEEK